MVIAYVNYYNLTVYPPSHYDRLWHEHGLYFKMEKSSYVNKRINSSLSVINDEKMLRQFYQFKMVFGMCEYHRIIILGSTIAEEIIIPHTASNVRVWTTVLVFTSCVALFVFAANQVCKSIYTSRSRSLFTANKVCNFINAAPTR